MFDLSLRVFKDKVLLPAARILSSFATANTYTLIGLACGVLGSVALAGGFLTLGLALWVLNRFFDGLFNLSHSLTL